MKQLKDTKIEYKIKIVILRKHFVEKGCHSNIPYQIGCEIRDVRGMSYSGYPYTKKGKKRTIKVFKTRVIFMKPIKCFICKEVKQPNCLVYLGFLLNLKETKVICLECQLSLFSQSFYYEDKELNKLINFIR